MLSDQGALYIVEIFEKNMSLLELDLASNSIREEGIGALGAALKHGIVAGSKLSAVGTLLGRDKFPLFFKSVCARVEKR